MKRYYWSQEKDWEFIRYDFEAEEQEDVATMEEESNAIRQSLQRLLPSYFQAMISAKTGLEAATVFYHFLLQSGVATQLKMWRLQAIEAGQLETARNHEQTWDALMSLLDEYVTVYGESSFDFTTFQEIFVSGLEAFAL